MKRLTKLQQSFINENISKESYIAFSIDIFQSEEYIKWRKNKIAEHTRKYSPHNNQYTKGRKRDSHRVI